MTFLLIPGDCGVDELTNADLDLLDLIIQNDLNYEYPRSFYRKRGNGMPNINKDYDNMKLSFTKKLFPHLLHIIIRDG